MKLAVCVIFNCQVVQDPGFDETLSFTINLMISPLVTKRRGCLRMFARVTMDGVLKTYMIDIVVDHSKKSLLIPGSGVQHFFNAVTSDPATTRQCNTASVTRVKYEKIFASRVKMESCHIQCLAVM